MSDKREQQSDESGETLLPSGSGSQTVMNCRPTKRRCFVMHFEPTAPFRKLVNADLEVDALLRVQQIERTAETFLQQVMAGVSTSSANGSPSLATVSATVPTVLALYRPVLPLRQGELRRLS